MAVRLEVPRGLARADDMRMGRRRSPAERVEQADRTLLLLTAGAALVGVTVLASKGVRTFDARSSAVLREAGSGEGE